MTDRRKPETKRQAQIVKALSDIGRIVIRVQSGKVQVRGGWMQLAQPGTPDLYVAGFGFLETKTPEGKLSAAQKFMHSKLRFAGERVEVALTPSEAVGWIRQHRKEYAT